MKLKGKIAVITGGSSGIGLAAARAFLAEGATVVITGRTKKTLELAQKKLGRGILAVRGDVGKTADLDNLFAKTKAKFGRIDILFVNAGIAIFKPVSQFNERDFDDTVDTNFKGAYFTVQKALPLMRREGTVIFNASAAHLKGFPNSVVYSATKAAVRSMARTLASELAPKGIRVNTLSPGPIETPIFSKLGMSPADLKQWLDGFSKQVPLGRMGTAEEMGRAAVFLASNDSAYSTGIDLVADGGLSQV